MCNIAHVSGATGNVAWMQWVLEQLADGPDQKRLAKAAVHGSEPLFVDRSDGATPVEYRRGEPFLVSSAEACHQIADFTAGITSEHVLEIVDPATMRAARLYRL